MFQFLHEARPALYYYYYYYKKKQQQEQQQLLKRIICWWKVLNEIRNPKHLLTYSFLDLDPNEAPCPLTPIKLSTRFTMMWGKSLHPRKKHLELMPNP